MKLFLVLVAMAVSAFAAEGETGTGCIWTNNKAICTVTNNTDSKSKCDVRIQLTTTSTQKTTKKQIELDPHRAEFIDALAPWDNKIERAQVAAICKKE